MVMRLRASLRMLRVEYENDGMIRYRFIQLIMPGVNKETSKFKKIFISTLRIPSEKWNSGRKLVRFL